MGNGNWETAGRESYEEYCCSTEGYLVVIGMASTLYCRKASIIIYHGNNNKSSIGVQTLGQLCVFLTLNRYFYPSRHPAQQAVSVPILQ